MSGDPDIRVSGDWLSAPPTQAVFRMLTAGGAQVFAVGGCVRNSLLGVPVADVDFATDALPDSIETLARIAGLRSIPTGKAHGTITVVANGVGHEVTTFRKDIETNGRHAVVRFADTLEEDAHRRDFTMNALYADSDGRISDPLGGRQDILAHRVRFIDDPDARIREDYLRILRFFRFHAWFGDPMGGIDAEALGAIAANADGLAALSKERIGAEMRKLLGAPDPAPSLASMAQTGVLARILPGADASAVAVLVHLEGTVRFNADWLLRLAALGGGGAGAALCLSKVEKRRLKVLIENIATTTPAPELAYRHGAPTAIGTMLLRAVLLNATLPADICQKSAWAAAQKFPVRAADITTGETGPALGAKLATLEGRWIRSGFSLGKSRLLA